MPKVKTIELTGTETAVRFPQNYPHYMILNMGDSEICASGNPGIVPYADGVYAVPAGAEIRVSPEASGDTVWLLGSGRVQVRAEEIAAQTSFRSRGKGGDTYAFLPYSEGLTYWFDFEKGYDPVQKIWRDQIRGLELSLSDTHPGDALTTASSEFSVPESSNQWAYTYYVVSKCRFPSDWKTVIGSYGTAPEFNLACRYGKYWIGTGSASGQMSTSVSVSDNFTVNCLSFSGGFGEWYCHRYSMTQPVKNYTSYHSPNNDRIQIGSKIDFKAIAIFKNISQGRDLILENMAFLKDKFQIE